MKNPNLMIFVWLSAALFVGWFFGTADQMAGQDTGGTSSNVIAASDLARQALGKAESMSGTIVMVEDGGNLFAVLGADGVPFSFRVTGHTRIKIAGKVAVFADLKYQMNKRATVEFVPKSDGGLAESVDVS